MKPILATLLAIATLATPAQAAFNSAYTDLDLDECLVLDADDFGASWACPGYKGYPLMVTEGDLRFALIYGFGAKAGDGQTLPPFVMQMLDRGLTGVLASLLRLGGPEWNANDGARQVDPAGARAHRAVP